MVEEVRELSRVVAADRSSCAISVEVPPDLVYFRGHFDELAILPAVALLDVVVLPRVESVWPEIGPLAAVRRCKFKRPIRPGDRLTVRLKRRGGEERFRCRVVFEVERDGRLYASGQLLFTSDE